MNACKGRRLIPLSMVMFVCLIIGVAPSAQSGYPHSAYYSPHNDRIFWFIQISDIHIGASGTQDSDNLRWIVNDARNVIQPNFIVASGDLTDSTNGGFVPNGPYQIEWDEYQAILDAAGMDASVYYDIPGNHDAYNDQFFSYYLANSVQGRTTGQTQVSWVRDFSFGTYHFLGVNTADNTGDPFSIIRPYGDHAGLDATELTFIQAELENHQDADLTLVFGHHPLFDTGVSTDTWLFYGQEAFVGYLDVYGASLYGYGHTHRFDEAIFSGNAYTGFMQGNGIHYFNIASLGKSDNNQYSIIAVDCNGISITTQQVETWPVVLITAPLSKTFGPDINPYVYDIPNRETNPIRALVFDENIITGVYYSIDGSDQLGVMNRVPSNPHLWEAVWDASPLALGLHTIEVQAVSASGTGTASIQVQLVTPTLYVSMDGDCGTKHPCFDSIQDAINVASNGFMILISSGTYATPISLAKRDTSVTLQGGWDVSFQNRDGDTILRHAPSVWKGLLTLQNLSIIPE